MFLLRVGDPRENWLQLMIDAVGQVDWQTQREAKVRKRRLALASLLWSLGVARGGDRS